LSEPPVIGVGIGDGLRSKQVLIDDKHTTSRRAGANTGRLWQPPHGSGSAPRREAICTAWRGRTDRNFKRYFVTTPAETAPSRRAKKSNNKNIRFHANFFSSLEPSSPNYSSP